MDQVRKIGAVDVVVFKTSFHHQLELQKQLH
jgi:hypothetical protein